VTGDRIQEPEARSKQRTGAREDAKSKLCSAELAVAEKFRAQELRSSGKAVIAGFFSGLASLKCRRFRIGISGQSSRAELLTPDSGHRFCDLMRFDLYDLNLAAACFRG
jgi:hypothetical protein